MSFLSFTAVMLYGDKSCKCQINDCTSHYMWLPRKTAVAIDLCIMPHVRTRQILGMTPSIYCQQIFLMSGFIILKNLA
jgi:hypothetical protein